MPTVLITPTAFYQKPAPYVDMLQDAGFEVRYPEDRFFSRGLSTEEDAVDQIKGAAALIAGGECMTGDVISQLPDLRVIARSGVGYDRVDVAAASERGIAVTITPTANHEAVAEQTLALLIGVAKDVVLNDKRVRNGRWTERLTQPIRGKTFGIIGLGRIGRSTAIRAKALGMTVIAAEKFPDQEFIQQHGIELVDFDALLARADYVSLHCPLNDETQGMMNQDAFAKMQPGSVLLNTSRGGVVVEADLLAALQSGHLSGAGLDVLEVEPPSTDNPLFELENVVFSPHLAGTDERSMEDMGIECADNIIKLSRGEWPDGAVVNSELRNAWRW